ncbi:MAG: MFS transporter [Candidatus Kariarchaeaceae archaeon]|jgi:UMF1 family MFS transporter
MTVQSPSIDTFLIPEKITIGAKRLDKWRYIAWVLYDIANTFYASGVLTLLSLTWILVVAQQNGFDYPEATLIYNYTIAIASVILAVLLPILGSMSDVLQQRKNYVIFFTVVCLVSTTVFLLSNNLWIILVVFAISMIAYQLSQVFYDAMLPGIVPPGREARLSSLAIALGYLGGAAIAGIGFFLSQNHDAPNADIDKGVITLGYSKILVIAVIIGFALLAIPLIFVKETNWEEVNKLVFVSETEWEEQDEDVIDHLPEKRDSMWDIAKRSFNELNETFLDIYRNNRGMFFYIIAYFIIADVANLIGLITVAFMRDAIHLSENDIYLIVAISGLSLIIFTYPIGRIIDKYGAKSGFQIIGILWLSAFTILIFEGIFFPNFFVFLAAAFLGPALSGVWVSQRQMVLELVPNEESLGRYFGLTKFSGKLSSALGPIIFSGTLFFFDKRIGTSLETAYRWSIFALALLLTLGFIVLHLKVPNKHEEFLNRKKRILQALHNAETGMSVVEDT